MPDVITSAGEVTPQWLTETLRRNGFLDSGSVESVSLNESRTLTVSIISHLEIEYSRDAPSIAPKRLFLKISNPEFQPGGAREYLPNEFKFYNVVSGLMPDPPLPRCFDAAFSEKAGSTHLLLEDLSETHYHPPPPLPPSLAECEGSVDCLARIHAYWWEHTQLGLSVGKLLSEPAVEQIARASADTFNRFADFLGDRLSGSRRKIFDKVIATFPRPWVRLTQAKGLTLTHGDAHSWNFLYPRESQNGRVYLFDWQTWHVHIGPRDLAYMITLFWYPERRARMEQTLLKRYHQGLLSNGVSNYTWDDCWKDYRWSAIRNLFIPVTQWSRGIAVWLWWSQLEKALLAFEDLNCMELIES
ncbi:MAG TPA: aminoglycoside phosphotransferase family protein [Pyrinomonadaceae bacterium]|nr:aminoglycoside phosphotransferase family protein [Pyrinomonadaceae bacterium]